MSIIAEGLQDQPVEASGHPTAPRFAVEQHQDDTIAVRGDQAEIRELLRSAGISSMLPMRDGVLVGRSSARAAMSALSA